MLVITLSDVIWNAIVPGFSFGSIVIAVIFYKEYKKEKSNE